MQSFRINTVYPNINTNYCEEITNIGNFNGNFYHMLNINKEYSKIDDLGQFF